MLLDTSGLMCLFDQRDSRHAAAAKHYDAATERLTHNYVLVEFVALEIARRAPLANAIGFIDAVQHSDEIEVVWS
jgi:predicted nucleic acid-binding protein